ncbi:MAG: hypothetical protein ACYDG5_03895 [Dehalococcoidales bacterium]
MAMLDLQISQSSDDASRHKTADYWNTTHTIAGAGYAASSYKGCGFAMRFQNATIPVGAVITSAYLTLRACATFTNTTVNTYLKGQNNSNPATFSTMVDFDARTWLSTVVNWDGIPVWTSGTDYQSPDISGLIQAIVNLPGWSSGNSLVLIWEDWELRSTQSDNTLRECYPYDGSATYAPKLHIEYSAATAKASSDTGTGTEATTSRELGAAETGSGAETKLVEAVILANDAGSGSEMGGLLKSLFGSDEGSGSDRVKILTGKAGSDLRLHNQRGQVSITHKEVNL